MAEPITTVSAAASSATKLSANWTASACAGVRASGGVARPTT
jgi:hypothetical protein